MADYRENVVSSVFLNVLQSNRSAELLTDILPACNEHQIFALKNADGLQAVVSQINNDLNTSRKRLQGLVLLQQVLGQCSAGVFTSNFHTWLNLMLPLLQPHGQPDHQQAALHILSTMIEKVTTFPELAREVATTKIKVIVTALLTLTSKKTKEAVVGCISSCILHFPGPTSFFKAKIETFLVQELDSVCLSQVHIRCYALLARCTSGGNRGEKHRESWTAQYDKIMSTLNHVLSQLYSGLESGEQEREDAVFLCPVPNQQPQQTIGLVRRFNTLCACLGAQLRESFPTWVPVPADEILRLICRTLAVQMDMLTKKGSSDHLLLLTYLPSLYCSAFTLLSHLIVCVKRLLVPSGQVIMRLCVQCLSSTQLHKSGSSVMASSFRKLRQCVYQALGTWLQITGSACTSDVGSKQSEITDLLTEIFSDVSLYQPEALQIDKASSRDSTQPPARKKKKGKKNNYLELSVSSHAVMSRASEDTVVAALKVLKLLMANLALFMDEHLLYSVKTKVCDLGSAMQQTPQPPYTSPQCRHALYAVLSATVSVPRSDPHFLRQAISLFERGVVDTQFIVSVTCREALSTCRSLLHPRTPCLQPPSVAPALTPSPLPFTPSTTTTELGHSNTTNNVVTTELGHSNTTNNVVTTELGHSNNVATTVSPVSSSKAVSSTKVHSSNFHRTSSSVHQTNAPSSSAIVEAQQLSPASVTDGMLGKASSSSHLNADSSSFSPTNISSKRKRESESENVSDNESDDNDEKSDDNENSDEDNNEDNDGGDGERGGDGSGEENMDVSEAVKTMEGVTNVSSSSPNTSTVQQESTSADTQMTEDVSAMMSSFVPCEADPGDDSDDSSD